MAQEFIGHRIVGVEVKPRSIAHVNSAFLGLDCTTKTPQPLPGADATGMFDVTYSYSVQFEYSEVKWASRWDAYLKSGEGHKVHWFAIINSMVIIKSYL